MTKLLSFEETPHLRSRSDVVPRHDMARRTELLAGTEDAYQPRCPYQQYATAKSTPLPLHNQESLLNVFFVLSYT
jgi:hypothetical protein